MNLVIFGPPGAGKGTQSAKLVKEFNLFQLSTGDLLRDEVSKKTSFGNKIYYAGITQPGQRCKVQILIS